MSPPNDRGYGYTADDLSLRERLTRLEAELREIRADLDAIKSWGKWAVVLLGGVILTAFANFVIRGGLG